VLYVQLVISALCTTGKLPLDDWTLFVTACR